MNIKKWTVALCLIILSIAIGAQSLRTIQTDLIESNVPSGNVDITSPLKLNSSTVAVDDILDEDDMATDSATALITQQSAKAYVDNAVSTMGGLGDVILTDTATNDTITWNGSAWINDDVIVTNTASILANTNNIAANTATLALTALLDDVTQTITASAFVGDGSGLTGVIADTTAIEADVATNTASILANTNDLVTVTASVLDNTNNVATNTASIAALTADDIDMNLLGSPNYTTIQDMNNGTQSAGIIEGGTITDSGSGEIDISTIEGIFKTTNSATGSNVFFTFSATSNIALTDENTNFIAIDYNGGTPQIVKGTSNIANGRTIFNLGKVYREGTALDIITSGIRVDDIPKRLQQQSVDSGALNFVSGATVGATGSLQLTVSAGVMYAGLNRIVTDAVDTSTGDTFEYYYHNGITWVESDETTINNTQYNDYLGGGLATLDNNKYGLHWVYKGTNGTTYVIYGRDSYTLTEAESETPIASLPPHVSGFGVLRAKIIIEKNGVAFTEIQKVVTTAFATSTPSNHNELSNIDGGAAGEYYHHTAAEYSTNHPYLNTANTFTESATFSQALTVGTTVSATAFEGDGSQLTGISQDLSGYAALDSSPTFTGTVTAASYEGFGGNLTGISVVSSLEGLSDTTLTSNATGDVLAYDGSAWVNSNDLNITGDATFQTVTMEATVTMPNLITDTVTYSNVLGVNESGKIVRLLGTTITPLTQTCYLKDVKAAGTSGGASSTSWATRVLNVLNEDGGISNDGSSFCSLSSNQFTLEAGTYKLKSDSTGYVTDAIRTKLVKDPSGTPVDLAISNSLYAGVAVTAVSKISVKFTITESTTFEIQFRASSAYGDGLGLGVNVDSLSEVYTMVEITKLQ